MYNSLHKCAVDYLKAFILVRKNEIPKSKLPKQGRIDGVIKGEKNLLKLAFNLRSSPNLLNSQMEVLKAEDNTIDQEPQLTNCHKIVVSAVSRDTLLASLLLEDVNRVENVSLCFNSDGKVNTE